jgi:hypothetical protein
MLLKSLKYAFICIKKKKLPRSTQKKTCPSDVNVCLNSETKLFNWLLVDCCTFGITQCYKIYVRRFKYDSTLCVYETQK